MKAILLKTVMKNQEHDSSCGAFFVSLTGYSYSFPAAFKITVFSVPQNEVVTIIESVAPCVGFI